MRDEINATYKLRKAALTQAGRDDATRAWRQALRAATYWYRDNAEES
jgi:hypothetical protein